MKHSNSSNRVRSCNIAFTRHGKCARAGPRAKLNGKDHPQFLGEGDETFMEDSGKNAILQDLTPYFCADVTWEDFDLCDLNKITLKYNRKTKLVSADTE